MVKKVMPSFCLGGDPVGGLNDCPHARRSSLSLVSDLGFTDHFIFAQNKIKSRSELLNNLAALILLWFQEDEFSPRPNYEHD